MITYRKLITKRSLFGSVLGAMLSLAIVGGCTFGDGTRDDRNSERAATSQVVSERENRRSGGEQGIGHEENESGGDASGSGEHSANEEGSDESVGAGGKQQSGAIISVMREGEDTAKEHGGRSESQDSRGKAGEGSEEHGPGSKEGGETGSDGDRESMEAAMSSPVIPLGQSWSGTLGGLTVSMQYDEATRTVHGTVRNTLSEQLCYVQAEPHLKTGTKTVGELGPDKLGHLIPGQEATSSLAVSSEPKLAGVPYDGYVVHIEVFDCGGSGPQAHEGGEGSEGEDQHGSDEEEGSGANALAPDETLDTVRNGGRLVLGYDASSNSFRGTVENTTGGVLNRVRVEVHLSNGTELGPTTPIDMAPGDVVAINLPVSQASFTGWTAHAEFGSGDEGSEPGREHRTESEHGSSTDKPPREQGSSRESGGEHGSGKESGDEHGSGRERRGHE